MGYLKPILDKKKDDDLIFATNEDSLKAKHTEEDYFYRLRTRVGLTDRYDNGIHKITLHSFRSWFITKCNRIDSDFGNALGGHGKYMKKYDRLTDSEKCELFIKSESSLSIFENVDTNENLKKIEELQCKLDELEDEKKRNAELRTTLDDLKLRVDLLMASKEKR